MVVALLLWWLVSTRLGLYGIVVSTYIGLVFDLYIGACYIFFPKRYSFGGYIECKPIEYHMKLVELSLDSGKSRNKAAKYI